MKKVIRSLIKSIPMVKRMDFEVERYHKNTGGNLWLKKE